MESRTSTDTVAFDHAALEQIARELDVVVASLDSMPDCAFWQSPAS